ncbi:MAG TPA: iron chelate uptake ABC transporter family permease subunit [Methylophilaceae bacterium]|nr:iron chelate uptake ABC transporter family permease subunit [Methylophilaceae bacterium]
MSILAPAFVAGLMVLATHVPLGRQVLARGIVFIDLAVAQIAALGLIAADLFGFEPHGWQVQAIAIGSALCAATILHSLERRCPEIQEALIGVMFVLAATAAIILVSHNPHGGEHLRDMLAGQILWVSWSSLIEPAIITALATVVWLMLRKRLGRLGFYLLFAVAITCSVQLVGVYLVFASLILPALAVRHSSSVARAGLATAYVIGAAGYITGLLVSSLFDFPSGPVIVWVLALIGIVYALLMSQRHDA